MYTIIYNKESGKVLSITSESNSENLRKAIAETNDFIFVKDLPSKDFYRQEFVVKDGKIVVRDLILTEEQEKAITKMENNLKISTLKEWFDTTYTYKEQKFRRLSALNKLDDDGIDAQLKLGVLYQEAEAKRAEIQALEKNNLTIV